MRDFAQMGDDDVITDKALTMLDGFGLMDQKILRTMIEMYELVVLSGLGTLSVNVAEERETVEDMYEPYLIKEFYQWTRSGRVATAKAYEHLGYESNEKWAKNF